MVKIGTKLPNFCLNRIRPLARVRSPPNNANFADQEKKDSCEKPAANGRKIMIVVDPSAVAKSRQPRHSKSRFGGFALWDGEAKIDSRIPAFLTSMKSMCQVKRPEVCMEVEVVEGKEAALLVVGQKKRSVTWRLMLTWAGGCMALAVRRKSKKIGGYEYLITTKRQKHFWHQFYVVDETIV
ncbi:hypothetical protein SASPL_110401 [Salvia splendens]|uniref:Uncharacterized protein n=1 Tax=Salvia splendens TaxID=180675 RepID=A0A8X8YAF9_SALSN|nr:hypothetical protein SASPL_110401 [Salvia splendens]